MPHKRTKDLQAEKATLFWLCKDPNKLPQALDWGLTADCFTHSSLQTFLMCLVECQGKGITGRRGIASQLQHYDGLGGKDLARLQGWILAPPEPEMQGELAVRTLTNLRKFNAAMSHTYDFFDNVKPINYDREAPGLVDYLLNLSSDVASRAIRLKDVIASHGGAEEYISTGYRQLDDLLRPRGYNEGGLARSRLITVTLPSGQGKTTFACNVAGRVAKAGWKVLFFSMEMERDRAWEWIVSPVALVPPYLIWQPDALGPPERESLRAAIDMLHENICIYDARLTISQMQMRIRAHQQEMGDKLFLVIIDRLALIPEDKKYDRRGDWKRQDEKSDALLRLGQETRTCLLCLKQMSSDAAEKWDAGMQLPGMKVFRGGAGPFISSDVVIAGGRHPGHVGAILMPEKSLCTVLHVKKVRDKGFDIGKVELKFVPEYKRLEEMI